MDTVLANADTAYHNPQGPPNTFSQARIKTIIRTDVISVPSASYFMPYFQAVVHTSDSGPGRAEFPAGCHSVFLTTPESGHGSNAASVAGSYQECACELGVGAGR